MKNATFWNENVEKVEISKSEGVFVKALSGLYQKQAKIALFGFIFYLSNLGMVQFM